MFALGALVGLSAVGACIGDTCGDSEVFVHDPNEPLVFGHTFSYWSIQWYKWVMPFPPSQSPELDQTGNATQNSQPGGPVYYLAGEHGALAPDRNITMPAYKPVVFPVLNTLVAYFPAQDGPFSFVKETGFAKQAQIEWGPIFDKPVIVEASLDGRPLGIVRDVTPVFDLKIPTENVFHDELKGSGDARAISAGYWVFLLSGFSAGNHTLVFYGHSDNGYFAGATYHIHAYK